MIERIVIVSFSLYQKSVQVLLLFPQEKISEDEDFEKDTNDPTSPPRRKLWTLPSSIEYGCILESTLSAVIRGIAIIFLILCQCERYDSQCAGVL